MRWDERVEKSVDFIAVAAVAMCMNSKYYNIWMRKRKNGKVEDFLILSVGMSLTSTLPNANYEKRKWEEEERREKLSRWEMKNKHDSLRASEEGLRILTNKDAKKLDRDEKRF